MMRHCMGAKNPIQAVLSTTWQAAISNWLIRQGGFGGDGELSGYSGRLGHSETNYRLPTADPHLYFSGRDAMLAGVIHRA